MADYDYGDNDYNRYLTSVAASQFGGVSDPRVMVQAGALGGLPFTPGLGARNFGSVPGWAPPSAAARPVSPGATNLSLDAMRRPPTNLTGSEPIISRWVPNAPPPNTGPAGPAQALGMGYGAGNAGPQRMVQTPNVADATPAPDVSSGTPDIPKSDWWSDFSQSPNMALAAMGLSMMAGKGNLGQQIGEGGLSALNVLQQQHREQNEDLWKQKELDQRAKQLDGEMKRWAGVSGDTAANLGERKQATAAEIASRERIAGGEQSIQSAAEQAREKYYEALGSGRIAGQNNANWRAAYTGNLRSFDAMYGPMAGTTPPENLATGQPYTADEWSLERANQAIPAQGAPAGKGGAGSAPADGLPRANSPSDVKKLGLKSGAKFMDNNGIIRTVP